MTPDRIHDFLLALAIVLAVFGPLIVWASFMIAMAQDPIGDFLCELDHGRADSKDFVSEPQKNLDTSA